MRGEAIEQRHWCGDGLSYQCWDMYGIMLEKEAIWHLFQQCWIRWVFTWFGCSVTDTGFSILTPTMLSATQMIPRAACAAGFPHSLYAVTFTVPLNSSVLYIALPSFPSCPNTLAFPTIHRVIMIWLSVMPSMPGMRPRWSLYMDGPTSVTMVCAWSWPTPFSSASSTVCLTTKSGQSRT